MAKRTILVDSARRELEKHGTETFPMTVNHDDLWSFEAKMCRFTGIMISKSTIREGEAVFRYTRKATGSERERDSAESKCTAQLQFTWK